MKLSNIFKRLKQKYVPVEFIFDESYSISMEKMLLLIERVSSSECWEKAFCKDVDPLVAAVRMAKTKGAKMNNNRLHVGYCHHDVEQVTAYLIRDKHKNQTLFSAAKYDWENKTRVHSFHPGNWIEFIEHSLAAGESDNDN